MSRVLVTGAGGMLGQDLLVALKGRGSLEVTPPSAPLDIADPTAHPRHRADRSAATKMRASAPPRPMTGSTDYWSD